MIEFICSVDDMLDGYMPVVSPAIQSSGIRLELRIGDQFFHRDAHCFWLHGTHYRDLLMWFEHSHGFRGDLTTKSGPVARRTASVAAK